jgi:hypothetical protein
MNMTISRWVASLVLVLALALPCAAADGPDAKGKFNDAGFLAYDGKQDWPTGEAAQVIKEFAVPIYIGLPSRPYRVLGRVYDDRTSGFGVMGRAFAEGLFSERDRQRDCALQAQYRGGDAVLITNDTRVIVTLGLSRDELSKTTPLFQHKDAATLVIKFQ